MILYTATGGLKATFLALYMHTAIIFLVMVTSVYNVKGYSSSPMYDGLTDLVANTLDQCWAIFSVFFMQAAQSIRSTRRARPDGGQQRRLVRHRAPPGRP